MVLQNLDALTGSLSQNNWTKRNFEVYKFYNNLMLFCSLADVMSKYYTSTTLDNFDFVVFIFTAVNII